MNRRDLARLAGGLLVFGPPGPEGDGTLDLAFGERQVGGLILFKRHTPSAEAAAALIHRADAAAGRPLWVMIDQEGGRVCRLSEARFVLPSARECATLAADDLQSRCRALGTALREVGIHINLAPVLDVDSNPANPVIGDRSFGRDPEQVFRLADAYRRGLEEAGVFGCGKHFPGHGDTALDSHTALPFVEHDLSRLHAVELAPFKRAIAAHWPMLMAAHVVFTALDPDEPATLSARVGRFLREDLGFRGVLLSDDLDMKAVCDRHDPHTFARLLMEAGLDQLLVCRSAERLFALHEALVDLMASGELPLARVEASLARVAALKAHQGLAE